MLGVCVCVCVGGECNIMYHASHHTTRCGCIWQTAHSEARFNTAARPPQAHWKQLKSGQASREEGEGWRERDNQSPALTLKLIYIFPAI